MDPVNCAGLVTAEVSASAHGTAGRTWPAFQSWSSLFNYSTLPAVSYQAPKIRGLILLLPSEFLLRHWGGYTINGPLEAVSLLKNLWLKTQRAVLYEAFCCGS